MDVTVASPSRRGAIAVGVALGVVLLLVAFPRAARADHTPYVKGDVFAGTGQGKITRYGPDGTVKDTLDTTTGSSEDTGMCFDAGGQLRSTNFEAANMSLFDNVGNLLQAIWATGFSGEPESCLVDRSGHIWVGISDSDEIREYDAGGTLLNTFHAQRQSRGTDFIDLAADQCTMFYTSEGSSIKRFNTCTNQQGTDFATGLPAPCYALRLLADGTVLVACARAVQHVDTTGAVVKTYTPAEPISGQLFALNVDPDGTSFWTADLANNGGIFRFDIASGTEIKHFASGAPVDVAGLAVFGERTVGGTQPSGNVSGTVFSDANSNGARDPGEAGQPNVIVYEDENGNSAQDVGEPSATTGADGTYLIPGIAPGGATIREFPPFGTKCTVPTPCQRDVTVPSSDTVTGQDFGNAPVGGVAGLSCKDVRVFTFVLHHGPGTKVVKVKVYVNGKLVKTVKGSDLKRLTIDKLPQQQSTVKIVSFHSNGSRLASKRTYLQCTKGKPKVVAHHRRRKHHKKKAATAQSPAQLRAAEQARERAIHGGAGAPSAYASDGH